MEVGDIFLFDLQQTNNAIISSPASVPTMTSMMSSHSLLDLTAHLNLVIKPGFLSS